MNPFWLIFFKWVVQPPTRKAFSEEFPLQSSVSDGNIDIHKSPTSPLTEHDSATRSTRWAPTIVINGGTWGPISRVILSQLSIYVRLFIGVPCPSIFNDPRGPPCTTLIQQVKFEHIALPGWLTCHSEIQPSAPRGTLRRKKEVDDNAFSLICEVSINMDCIPNKNSLFAYECLWVNVIPLPKRKNLNLPDVIQVKHRCFSLLLKFEWFHLGKTSWSGQIIATSHDLTPNGGSPLISGKSRLVKYYNLARSWWHSHIQERHLLEIQCKFKETLWGWQGISLIQAQKLLRVNNLPTTMIDDIWGRQLKDTKSRSTRMCVENIWNLKHLHSGNLT